MNKISEAGWWAVGLAIIGATMFSAKAVFIKLAYQYQVDSYTLMLLRMGIALPFFLGIGYWKNRSQPLEQKVTAKEVIFLVIAGIIGYYLASLLDFLGLKYVSASLERIILFVYPTLVVLLEWFVFRKPIHRLQWLAILLTYLGMVAVFYPEMQFSDQESVLIGGGLIFCSAFAFACYLLLSQRLIKIFGGVRFTSYAMIIATMCILLQQFAVVGFEKVFDLPLPVYSYGAAMAIISTVVPSYLISEAIRRIGAAKVSVIGSVGPVSTIILSIIFLDEKPTLWLLLGVLLVISGVLLVSKYKSSATKPK